MMSKKINFIVIEGRRWFEKVNGNTYHSARVYVNGEHIGSVDFEYGYGDQYIATGYMILKDKGIFSGSYTDFMNWKMENRKKIHITCCDVSRKKDL